MEIIVGYLAQPIQLAIEINKEGNKYYIMHIIFNFICVYMCMKHTIFQVLQVVLVEAYMAYFFFCCLFTLKIINQTLVEQYLNKWKVPSKAQNATENLKGYLSQGLGGSLCPSKWSEESTATLLNWRAHLAQAFLLHLHSELILNARRGILSFIWTDDKTSITAQIFLEEDAPEQKYIFQGFSRNNFNDLLQLL